MMRAAATGTSRLFSGASLQPPRCHIDMVYQDPPAPPAPPAPAPGAHSGKPHPHDIVPVQTSTSQRSERPRAPRGGRGRVGATRPGVVSGAEGALVVER